MLNFSEVTLRRGDHTILDRVSFEVPAGSIFTILGPSGAGKSTLLRLACRLFDPDGGTIRLDGTDIRELSVTALRRRVGFLAQEPVLFGATVREDLKFAADPAGGGALSDAGERLERVGLPADFVDRTPGQLSVGQRQRVALARALVPEPEVLLLDEATSALDPQAAAGILKLVRELRDEHSLTVAFVTHTVAQARRVADRVLVVADGRVVETGGPEIFDDPAEEATRALIAAEEEE
ncbi:MAG: phosphate ABC transporter ATP-binding protein [Planctomycetota bacterium]